MASSSDAAGSSAAGTSPAVDDDSRADRRETIARSSMRSESATSTTPSTASGISRRPGFTTEDEAAEKAALSACERIEIECDLRGISPEEAASRIFAGRVGTDNKNNDSRSRDGDNMNKSYSGASVEEVVAKVVGRKRKHIVLDDNDNKKSSDTLLRQLDRELRSIPDGEKGPYVRAIELQCPDALVSHPSGRSRFETVLRYCGDDPRVAAKRIVEYWEERRRTFGDDRYCLPMTLHGAMKDHVATLLERSGHVSAGRDNAARGILIFDLSMSGATDRIDATGDKLELWYMLECLCDYRSSQRQDAGAVFIMNCQGVSEASFHLLAVINQALLMLEVFPIHLRAIHIIRPSDFTVREVMPLVKLDIGRELRRRLVVHANCDDEENLGSLEEYGLSKALIRDAQDQKDWVHHRLAQEYADLHSLGGQALPSVTGRLSSNTITATGSGVDGSASLFKSDETTAGNNSSNSTYRACRRQSSEYSSSVDGSNGTESGATSERDVALALELIDESGNRSGRAGDERMSRAIKAKIKNPSLSPYDALIAGGFVFPKFQKGTKSSDIFDRDNVSLHQRKNQLSRRLRHVRDSVALKGGAEEGYLKIK